MVGRKIPPPIPGQSWDRKLEKVKISIMKGENSDSGRGKLEKGYSSGKVDKFIEKSEKRNNLSKNATLID